MFEGKRFGRGSKFLEATRTHPALSLFYPPGMLSIGG
jgi:hypothetical protein